MRFITALYTFLLLYIVIALLFWGHSLTLQSEIIYEHEMNSLNARINKIENPVQYTMAKTDIDDKWHSRSRQYVGEGIAFLAIIVIAAGVVYTSMRKNIQLSKQQTNFMLSVTHELKSPIAAVKLNLETIGKRKLTEDQLKTLVNRSIKETNRLNDLCNNLLVATQMETRDAQTAAEEFDFSEMVSDSCTLFAERGAMPIETNIQEGCYTVGDIFLWKMVISNLIENAMKYAPNSPYISVGIEKVDENIVFNVSDLGVGISDEEKQKIFLKFYRVGNENSRKTKGTGLGLYITAAIVKQHKGTIEIRDNVPNGSIFEITLPAVS